MKKSIHIFSIAFISLLLWSCSSDDSNPQITTSPFENATLCENGMAGIYPCNGYDLMEVMPLIVFGASAGNDSWGWTDPATGKEYALFGTDVNTAFIDITNPTEPIYLGNLPTATVESTWRDIKVYNNHAFIVSEAPGHGMQVF